MRRVHSVPSIIDILRNVMGGAATASGVTEKSEARKADPLSEARIVLDDGDSPILQHSTFLQPKDSTNEQSEHDAATTETCGFDNMFMIFSFGELGRRQLTDNIRKDVYTSLNNVPIVCTKTSAFSEMKSGKHGSDTDRSSTRAKSLQMFLFCKRKHAATVRARLRDIIGSRKSRKYFTQTIGGGTHAGVPVFFHEFTSDKPVYISKERHT
ncbi:nuclear protein [Psittacid alphaherpesvirus 5]|uniref:Nuclear protein n=1 Tax=Psittacid alphaherpesvirus 5 TaxID=2972693 RepID=A0A5P9JST8_9ALPH|nr:nuclear protein [Psittacid alphaherpesvirus 5]QFU14600.1 nuclear protein [Psittacid alphaherpesvirus 5]UOO01071.1 nuclear protein [Psittacid alphaherpesvirus 5]